KTTLRRSAEGNFLFSNTDLWKIEGDAPVQFDAAFDGFYHRYIYDRYSDCVSKYGGYIVPQKRWVIGNPTCHMSVQFVSFV
ncbi:hypothetical protein AAVH_40993, partial [Aphelenchoides avenae]